MSSVCRLPRGSVSGAGHGFARRILEILTGAPVPKMNLLERTEYLESSCGLWSYSVLDARLRPTSGPPRGRRRRGGHEFESVETVARLQLETPLDSACLVTR